MNIEKKTITDKIFLLIFDNQLDITSTFLRFQEFYESPEFSGKIFTLEEYQKWYTAEKGSFSYYEDWNGFNIPSHILKPFYEGKFDPLSEKEKQLLALFENQQGSFYIIGTHKGAKNIEALLRHEIAHGLYYSNIEYREKIKNALVGYDTEKVKDNLRSKSGYNEDVLDDEVHAYIIDGSKSSGDIIKNVPDQLITSLQNIFNQYYIDIDVK